jgi:hypothetical protein
VGSAIESAVVLAAEAAPQASAVVVPSDDELDATELNASKLHCYQVALELHSLCSTLVASFSNRIVKDQLERASLSVVLNIAEGGGRRPGGTRPASTPSLGAARRRWRR